MIKSIDNLIEHLKGINPYGKTETFKLWEALKLLSDGLLEIDKTMTGLRKSNYLEIPSGIIDGANTEFILSSKPVDSFIAGFADGLLLIRDIDFKINDKRVIMTVPPPIGTVLQFLYSI